MAQKVEIVLVDDLDGTPADETISFAFEGVEYELDLNTANAGKFREAIASWIGHSRRTGGRRRSGAAASPRGGSNRSEAAEIRAWAADQGIEVSSRGRIPVEVREAWAKR